MVRRLLKEVDFARATTIVEFGVGTGCVTRAILRRMRPDARLIALEINPDFLDACCDVHDPRLTLRESCASHLSDVLREEGLGKVDAIVSSLPLAIIPDDVVDRIIEASRASLRPGGRFVQYQYTLADYERMTERFPGVTLGFMPLNIPPAFVYGCSLEPTPPAARARSRAASIYAAVLAMATVVIRTVQEL